MALQNNETPKTISGKAERLLAWIAILYGLTILNPWTNVFTAYYVYNTMARINHSEWFWGLAIAASGMTQWLGWRFRWRSIRLVASANGILMWLSLAALFALGGLTSFQPRAVFVAFTAPGVLLFAAWGTFQAEIFVELLRKR